MYSLSFFYIVHMCLLHKLNCSFELHYCLYLHNNAYALGIIKVYPWTIYTHLFLQESLVQGHVIHRSFIFLKVCIDQLTLWFLGERPIRRQLHACHRAYYRARLATLFDFGSEVKLVDTIYYYRKKTPQYPNVWSKMILNYQSQYLALLSETKTFTCENSISAFGHHSWWNIE